MTKGVPLLSTSCPFEMAKPAKPAAGSNSRVQMIAARLNARRMVLMKSPSGSVSIRFQPRRDLMRSASPLMQANILMSCAQSRCPCRCPSLVALTRHAYALHMEILSEKVYECTLAVEAHMVCDLLSQAGISARVDGEFMQSAMGE